MPVWFASNYIIHIKRRRSMSKLTVFAAGLAAVPVLAFGGVVSAAGAGQIEGGDIYRAKNITSNIDFSDQVNATCGETVQFKVRIHNPGPSALQNVKVVATLPSAAATTHTSTVTVSSPYADPSSTSDTATVKLDKSAKLMYVAGSTELLDDSNAKLSALGDTITTTGVKVDSVGVSVQEKRYVQFQAKVNCPEVPETPEVPEKPTPEVPEQPEAPTALPNVGAGDVLGIFAAATLAGAAAHRWFIGRRLGNQ
jgi:uncharacterized repeat protein (TIGR01451 family)